MDQKAINRRIIPVLSALLAVFLSSARAAGDPAGALKWEKTIYEVHASPGEKEVTAAYSFTNASDHPVKIRNIHTSCGCTTVEGYRKEYAAGDSGFIKVRFVFGSRKGRQEKTVVVETAEGETRRYHLLLRVDIADSVNISKRKLTWEVGDPLEAQFVDVKPLDSKATQVKGIRTIGSMFAADLLGPDKENWRIRVTPVSTEKPARGTIRVEIAEKAGSRAFYIPVGVE